ncbi:hypothetical protein BDR03DRAFT_526788 [Suillus americanus]|nr:hypothetical protein BDR03DRAFT_526788 [Suillus americanus]
MLLKRSTAERTRQPKNGPHAQQPSAKDKQSQDDNVVQLLDATISAINATKDLVPIDLAKGILGTIANILTIAQAVIKNKSDFRVIADNLPGYLRHALSELNKSVNHINSDVESKKERKFWEKLWAVRIDRNQIADWEKDLDRVLGLFHVEVVTGIAITVEKLALGPRGNTHGINDTQYRPPEPPSRPSMFYGRGDLVAELTDLVVNNEHIALIGPGGIGKSSLAKTILHETVIMQKFANRRYFVTYDGMDPSVITFEAFATRFAEALGIELAGGNLMRQISTCLRSASALVVLDNAETFEEADGSSALKEIPQAIAEIAGIPGVILILTSRSRRSAPNVPWITKDVPPLDSNSAQEAFFQIYHQASRQNAEGGIANLLQDLEFHPLSINILANAAQQNGWSPVMLLERWNDWHSKVLNLGEGKSQSLSYTMQLSLSSPSIQNFGEEARHVLAVIAFLPQGLNEVMSKRILPSTLQIDTICDVLWRQSLVYRQDGFVKMLAPIRHHVRDSLPPPDSTCLREIRTFYYCTIQQCSAQRDGHADIIISDHLNIEHVIAFDLAHIPEETYRACWGFLGCLTWHLPRPTTLNPAIFDIVENFPARMPKASCLLRLGRLSQTLSQINESMKAFQAAGALYLAASDHGMVAECAIECAEIYRCQGRFFQSQQFLWGFQRSWNYLSEPMKAIFWYYLDSARMYTFATSADELFVQSSGNHIWGLRSNIWYWRTKMYYGGYLVQVNAHLENLLPQCSSTGHLFIRRDVLLGLAEVAMCQGRLSDAMDNLQKIVEMFQGQFPHDVLLFTALKALVASKQGDHAFARELINPTPGLLQPFALRTTWISLVRSYSAACVELTAGAYDRAQSHFIAAIEGCDIQGDLIFKAFSKRGLGEIAFVRGDFALAAQCFTEIRPLCTEMGVPLQHLYSCAPFYILPDRFRGWSFFLNGWSPFANIM